jgi:hypothetical protein
VNRTFAHPSRLGGEIVAAAAISADEDGAKRRPQAAGRRSRLLDPIEPISAMQAWSMQAWSRYGVGEVVLRRASAPAIVKRPGFVVASSGGFSVQACHFAASPACLVQ